MERNELYQYFKMHQVNMLGGNVGLKTFFLLKSSPEMQMVVVPRFYLIS
jgi:hypothetical protein